MDDFEEYEEQEEEYDSTDDTLQHIQNIQFVMNTLIIVALLRRSKHHDESKLENPEKPCYDKYIPLLKKYDYGSKEYEDTKKAMAKDGMDHHFKENRHHVEHYKNGINDMTLIDIVEMVCDWFAASLRSDSSFLEGLDLNKKKYHIPDEMVNIFTNTYNEYFKDVDKIAHRVDFSDYRPIIIKKLDEAHSKETVSDSEYRFIKNEMNRIMKLNDKTNGIFDFISNL